MDKEIRKTVADTGKILLEKRLVARTWGNISARIDDKSYAITPSGLDYIQMVDEDIVTVNFFEGIWQGKHKPSGEKGIHTAAYKTFKDTNFVIHTHQNYATAIGLAGFEQMDITEEEKKELGGIAIAGYGLPGTGKLTKNVEKMLETKAHVILMEHHGVLICGKDRDDALKKAILLEKICERNMKGQNELTKAKEEKLPVGVSKQFPNAKLVQTPAVWSVAMQRLEVSAQLDDMAQMIGGKIVKCGENAETIIQKLKKYPAIMLCGKGIVINAEDVSDVEALEILVDKACICKLHTNYYGVKAKLSWLDDTLMHFVYMKKYSKQKQA